MQMVRSVKRYVKQKMKRLGYRLERIPAYEYSPSSKMRTRLMEALGIDLLFSVGANQGQFDMEVRRLGYKGRIISFEPVREAFELLSRNAQGDPGWTTVHCALGNSEGHIRIHVANNSYSSSILDMLPSHLESAPHSKYVAEEEVRVQTLDGIIDTYAGPSDSIMLKIDTQGYERNVLAGALRSLPRIRLLQMEMSLLPLYTGEMLMPDMCKWMDELGFALYLLENEFVHPKTGRLLQVNGIFIRKDFQEVLAPPAP
jgi:FkbM family methyltransferase